MKPKQPIKSLQESDKEIIEHIKKCFQLYMGFDTPDKALECFKQFQRQEAEGWVKVEDRLPEDLVYVVVALSDGNVITDCYDMEFKHWCKIPFNGRTITHWQKLPSPPESK